MNAFFQHVQLCLGPRVCMRAARPHHAYTSVDSMHTHTHSLAQGASIYTPTHHPHITWYTYDDNNHTVIGQSPACRTTAHLSAMGRYAPTISNHTPLHTHTHTHTDTHTHNNMTMRHNHVCVVYKVGRAQVHFTSDSFLCSMMRIVRLAACNMRTLA